MLLNLLLFKSESIFVPHKVRLFWVDVIFGHAIFEEANDVAVVGVLREGQASAVMHEFLELIWLVLAKVFDSDLLLFLLDVGVLLGLGSAWKTLPRE